MPSNKERKKRMLEFEKKTKRLCLTYGKEKINKEKKFDGSGAIVYVNTDTKMLLGAYMAGRTTGKYRMLELMIIALEPLVPPH